MSTLKNYRFLKDRLMVRCSLCNTWKEKDEMAPDTTKPYGTDTRCRVCKKEWSKDLDSKSQAWKSLREWLLRYTSLYVFLKDNIRHISIRSQSKKYNEYLGCSPEDAWNYILDQREPWMTLDNYGGNNDGTWNIDHHVPFEMAKSSKEMLRLAHYTNLRPMRSNENRLREDTPEQKIKEILGRRSNEDPIETYKDPENLKEIVNKFKNSDKFIYTINTRFTTDTNFYTDRISAALYKSNISKESYLENVPDNKADRVAYNAQIKNLVIENLSLGKRIPVNNQLTINFEE